MTRPPNFGEYPKTPEGIAECGRARKEHFDNLKRREPRPRPRAEKIYVDRIEYRDRIVEKRVEVPVENTEKLTNLERALREAQAKVNAQPKSVAVPEHLRDVIDWTAPPKARQEKLIALWNEVNGPIMLAEDRGQRVSSDQYRRRDRIQQSMEINAPTLVEQI